MSNMKNQVRLIGNLGMDPEIREISGNRKIAKFSLATNETYRNEKGERVTETQWHNLVGWGKIATITEKYLHKGSEIAVEGKLNNRSYTDKEGNKKYVSEVVVSDLVLLGRNKNGGSIV
jgi:single-strand DNA-binding protein